MIAGDPALKHGMRDLLRINTTSLREIPLTVIPNEVPIYQHGMGNLIITS